jgi:hypothetical protein
MLHHTGLRCNCLESRTIVRYYRHQLATVEAADRGGVFKADQGRVLCLNMV